MPSQVRNGAVSQSLQCAQLLLDLPAPAQDMHVLHFKLVQGVGIVQAIIWHLHRATECTACSSRLPPARTYPEQGSICCGHFCFTLCKSSCTTYPSGV